MCIFKCTTPMRRQAIGKMHNTPAQALRAAARHAKRLGVHVHVEHWREGRRFTVLPDGKIFR